MSAPRLEAPSFIRRGQRVPASEAEHVWLLADMEDNARARDIFWRIVKDQRPTLLENLNDALLGLVYARGTVAVLYDTAVARRIFDESWVINARATPESRQHAEAEQEKRWHDTLFGDFGDASPWWVWTI